MQKTDWTALAAKLFCVCLALIFGVLFLRYLLPVLLPFLIAWLISLGVRPMADKLARKTGIPVRVLAVVLPAVVFAGLAVLLGFGIHRGAQELSRLLTRLLDEEGALRGDLTDRILTGQDWLFRLPPLAGMDGEKLLTLQESLRDLTERILGGIVTSVSQSLPNLIGRLLAALPDVFLMLLVGVVAGFYFCLDGERMTGRCMALLPPSLAGKAEDLRKRLKRLSFRYLRAYLQLFLVTLASLFLGFALLRVEYALVLSLVIALVDLFPVLGVGTVLLPWAVICLFQKNFYLGFGLLILYVIILILRQVLEPRLVGSSLGIHPLLTLVASYVGFRLFGFLGMLLGPFLALLIKFFILQTVQYRSDTQGERM
ncbi:MAG: sporulation integral membrane protein YtvI [Clostridia bacterium]|nr:sporulation integral membrane protein YtvI [Clostridia bacterium]